MQIWLLLFGFAYICGVRCEGDIHWLYSMTVSHEFAYMRCIIFRITSVKLKRAVSRDDSVSFYPCALWKRASIVTLLTASAELAWDLHGEFQRLHNSSYQAEVFLCWPEIFLLKHQYHSCSLNFQSSTPYVYSIFAGLQVFRETDCIPFTVFLTYKVGQRRQNASISWTESLRISCYANPFVCLFVNRYWWMRSGSTPLLPGTLWKHWGKLLVYLPSRIHGQWGGY